MTQPRKTKPKGKSGDLVGRRHWSLVAVALENQAGDLWKIQCDCGEDLVLSRAAFFQKRSCGCHRTGGLKLEPWQFEIRQTWLGMLSRCNDKKDFLHADYGGRGIKVCRMWKRDFLNFCKDMGPRPSKDHTVERVDVNGDYTPDNCVWLLKNLQSRNTRRTIRLIYKGINTTLIEFLELYPMFERKDFMFVSKELKKNGRKPVDVTEAIKVLCHFKGVTPP